MSAPRCGRFIQGTSGDRLAERFHRSAIPHRTPRAIALCGSWTGLPEEQVQPVIIVEGSPEFAAADTVARGAVALRWGRVPAWSPEPRTAYRTINARAETVPDQPTYRQALRQRRGLIPADGFYEGHPLGARKPPYCIAPVNGQPLAFAGL